MRDALFLHSGDVTRPTLQPDFTHLENAMAHPTSPSLLARWARVRKGVARAPEPADMGTAYGMEWSLGQDPRMAEPAAASPSPAPGWFERWSSGKTSR